jgi:hypothetical protein
MTMEANPKKQQERMALSKGLNQKPKKSYVEIEKSSETHSQWSNATRNNTRARGPYRKYDERTKRHAIATAKRFRFDFKKTEEAIGIQAKSIKRWVRDGVVRIRGGFASQGGRKVADPAMEAKLSKWLNLYFLDNGQKPSNKDIRRKAIDLSSNQNRFKASKGWLEKFIKRFVKRQTLPN